jgi:thiamine pyrophosphate-dependent acetolactate synthase large subunit-like protein
MPNTPNPRDSALRTLHSALSRLALTQRLVALLTHGEAIIGGIGNTKFDLVAAGHRPENFYMLGSMGLAIPIALGVALAQPERQVIALEGDGSLLMNLGCLATVAAAAPPNLTIIVWDNGSYQITGNQRTATAIATDLVAVAKGAGIANSAWATTPDHFADLVIHALATPAPTLIAARIDHTPGHGRPDWDPVILKDRFMRGIGAKQ